MKFLLKLTVVLAVLGGAGYLGYPHALAYWKARNAPQFRDAEVARGEVVAVVNATGTIQPVLRVSVGSVVSGPIEKLYVDYNERVEKGQLMAKIDPRLFDAAVKRDEALLRRSEAEVVRMEAMIAQAHNDYQRALALREENADFISDAEIDQYKYNHKALEAQLAAAVASRDQAQANLENSEANLGYTDISSPVDGIVIDRKIDEGQSLAAQFQTPELFIVAPDMEKEMYVYASVDEADVGMIREAQETGQPVYFTVDAYPDDLFEGTIKQIRMNPTTTLNVVTYPVVVSVPNPDLKLYPGMTANLSFQVARREGAIKIPNAALRFYPQKEHVRTEDQSVLEGADDEAEVRDAESTDLRSAVERMLARNERRKRHVWIREGDRLKAVEVTTGLSDHRYTELLTGEVDEGDKLVTGVK